LLWMRHDAHAAVLRPPGPAEKMDLRAPPQLQDVVNDGVQIFTRLLGRHVSVGPGGAAKAPDIGGEDIKALPRQDVHEAIRRLPWHLEVKALPARRGRAVGDDDRLASGVPEGLFPDVEFESGMLHPVLHPTDLLSGHK